jgi:hypothetical protein
MSGILFVELTSGMKSDELYEGLIWFSTILNPLRLSATKGPVPCFDNCRKPNLPCIP